MTHTDTLACDFPTWRVWRAGGMWLATRRYRLTDDQLNAGLFATLAEDSAADLRRELDRQRAREDRYR